MMDVATLKADIAELKREISLCKAEYVVTASETANKSELRRLILAKEQQLIPYFKMLQQGTFILQHYFAPSDKPRLYSNSTCHCSPHACGCCKCAFFEHLLGS